MFRNWPKAILLYTACSFSAVAVAQSPPVTAPSTAYDLNGEWQANYTLPEGIVPHRIMIVSLGAEVTATKITGDKYVPAGKVTMKGAYSSNPFEVQVQCAGLGYRNPRWGTGTVTVIDNNHMIVRVGGGGCRTESDDWSRVGKPTLALDNAILFDFDKYELKPDAQATLDKVLAWLNEKHPASHLLVAGYTDDRGTEGSSPRR
jgi:hypothetical protein